MKIGLEISSLAFPLSGIQVYIRNFLKALLDTDRENEYLLTAKLNRIKKIKENNIEAFWFKQYDIFHGFDGFIPRFVFAKLKSAVVHDIIPFTAPRFVSSSTRRNFERKIYKLLKRADILITPSEYTRMALSSYFQVGRMFVIYEACPENYRKLKNEEIIEFKKRLGIDDYLLYVGVINARKNVDGLIKSFLVVKSRFKKLKLIIISSYIGFQSEKVLELIEKNQDSIIFLQNVPENDLIYFYNSATLFVFPSFAEGFGLPVLEAMACGVPVVTSNTSALPEVGGEAVEYVDPNNVDDIAMKIIQLLENEERRAKLRTAGLIRAKNFSWEKSAKELLEIWRKCLNQ